MKRETLTITPRPREHLAEMATIPMNTIRVESVRWSVLRLKMCFIEDFLSASNFQLPVREPTGCPNMLKSWLESSAYELLSFSFQHKVLHSRSYFIRLRLCN
jgi:hypothetical protein